MSNDTDEIYATCLLCGQYGIGRDHDKTCPQLNESPVERALRYMKPFAPPDPDYVCGAAFCDDPACKNHNA